MTAAREELQARTESDYLELARVLADNQNEFMNNLVQARIRAGLTQGDVAKLLGVRQATVSQFEHYDNDPKLSTVRRYALAIGARLDWSLTEYDTWKPVAVPNFTRLSTVAQPGVSSKSRRVPSPRSATEVEEFSLTA